MTWHRCLPRRHHCRQRWHRHPHRQPDSPAPSRPGLRHQPCPRWRSHPGHWHRCHSRWPGCWGRSSSPDRRRRWQCSGDWKLRCWRPGPRPGSRRPRHCCRRRRIGRPRRRPASPPRCCPHRRHRRRNPAPWRRRRWLRCCRWCRHNRYTRRRWRCWSRPRPKPGGRWPTSPSPPPWQLDQTRSRKHHWLWMTDQTRSRKHRWLWMTDQTRWRWYRWPWNTHRTSCYPSRWPWNTRRTRWTHPRRHRPQIRKHSYPHFGLRKLPRTHWNRYRWLWPYIRTHWKLHPWPGHSVRRQMH